MKQLEEILIATKTTVKRLIDPTTGNPSSSTYRKVREGTGGIYSEKDTPY